MWNTPLPSDPSLTVRIEAHGPFFTKSPGKTLRGNLMDMLDEMAEFMEDEVDAAIQSHRDGMPLWTGWTLAKNVGYTTSKKTGRRWTTYAAVGTVTAGMGRDDAIRTKAAAASIERRWHPWRNLKSGLYRARPLLTADLAKGLE
jgi:hypothetical protein